MNQLEVHLRFVVKIIKHSDHEKDNVSIATINEGYFSIILECALELNVSNFLL
jgi:hypothetical protein